MSHLRVHLLVNHVRVDRSNVYSEPREVQPPLCTAVLKRVAAPEVVVVVHTTDTFMNSIIEGGHVKDSFS